ncbi:MAG: transporter substrate-binding domain-containing protein [Hyphomicrobiales bacterium]
MKINRYAGAIVALALMAGGALAADKQKLTVATEGAYPPYNFVAADGTLQGFDVDFAKAVCEKINADCTIIKQDWDGMIPGLLAKKYDLIIASMGILPEREEKIDFTIPYYQAPTILVAAKSAGIKAMADGMVDPASLSGKKIGVQRATGYESYARKQWPAAEIVVYDTPESADLDMTAGRLDARFDDGILLKKGLLASPEASNFEQVGKVLPESAFGSKGEGIGVRKGETALKESVNKAILDMRADGTYKTINDKYFDFDIYGQ